MPTRRRAIIGLGTAALLMTSPRWMPHAWAQAIPEAVTFVKTTSDRLVAVVNSVDTPKEKRRRLQEVMDSSVDVGDIARFCLGRFWRTATPDQQEQYMGLFHDLLLTKITDHFGEYQGVRVVMGPARASGDTEIVITTVERPKEPTMQVDWVVSTSTGSPKIIDLLAGGTSLRLTQSSDFTAYLSRHQYDIHQLIDGMHQLIAQNQ
jgi:phospholipid transport system substrate-binding protein